MKIPAVVVKDLMHGLREAATNMVYEDAQRELDVTSVADLVDQVMAAHPDPLVRRLGMWMIAQIGGQNAPED